MGSSRNRGDIVNYSDNLVFVFFTGFVKGHALLYCESERVNNSPDILVLVNNDEPYNTRKGRLTARYCGLEPIGRTARSLRFKKSHPRTSEYTSLKISGILKAI